MSTDHAFTTTADRAPQRPRDGVLRVPRDVMEEVLKTHTSEQLNALPYEQRLALAEAAVARIEARKRAGDGSDAAAQIRAERERRKAEAWAKRQPKGQG